MKTGYPMGALMNRIRRFALLATLKLIIAFVAGAQPTTQTILPADGAFVPSVLLPTFQWKENGFSACRFRIVRIAAGETPPSAIDRNPMVIDLVIAGAIYQYSPFDPSLEGLEPTRYAWSVTPIDREGRERVEWRMIASFTVGDLSTQPPSTGGSSPAPSLVDCHCGPLRFILPPRLCTALGGSTAPTDEKTDSAEGGESASRPSAEWATTPESVPPSGSTVRFRLSGVDASAVVLVTMSGSMSEEPRMFPATVAEDGSGFVMLKDLPVGGLQLFEVAVTTIDGRAARDRFTAMIGAVPPPATGSSLPTPTLLYNAGSVPAYVIDADVADAERRARDAGARAEAARRKRDEQNGARGSAAAAADEARSRAAELIRIDKVLDRVPGAYRDQIDSLLGRLDSLRNSLGGTIDTVALDSAVAAAKQRRDDCRKTRQDLEKEKADLEEERDRLKKEQDDLLKQMDALHPASEGWSGRSGYHADGTVNWGYIRVSDGRSSGWDNDHSNAYYNLRKEIRSRNKAYKNAIKRLKELEQELADADRDCDEREQDVRDAEDARDRGDQGAAIQKELDELCRQMRALLNRLRVWCQEHPSLCDWDDTLEGLLSDCPADAGAWEEFWGGFAGVIEQKQAREREQETRRDSLDREVTRLDSVIAETDKEIRDEEEEEDEEWDNARRLRRQQAQEAMERRRMEEAAKRQGTAAAAQAQRDCLDGFARWIASNQEHVSQSDLDALQKVVEGAQIVAESAGEYAGGMAKGATPGVSGMSAVATGLFSLGTSLFYAWMENTMKGAVKRIADRHVLNILGASLMDDKRPCGMIQGIGLDGKPSTTSFYFFRRGNQVLIFRISATHGFECLGVTDA